MKTNRTVISLKYGGHDCAAAVMRGHELIAACEQERYTLDKHSRLFPIDAVRDCLKISGISDVNSVDELAFVNDLKYYVRKTYLEPAVRSDERLQFMANDIDRIKGALFMEDLIREKTQFDGPINFYRHHLCHLASAYYPSGFDECLLASYDGLGEIESGMIGFGSDGDITVLHDATVNPHSLGLLYSAVTDYLGWRHHCDEGIIMGLAPYGDAHARIPGNQRTYYDVFSEILRETGDFDYVVDQNWMAYYHERDVWVGKPFLETFGERRKYDSPVTAHHKNIAAALQTRIEDVVIAQLERGRNKFGYKRLALAGGVGLNCSLNGRILASGIFDEIFVQPAAGDAGTTIGACYLAQRKADDTLRPKRYTNYFTGSRFTEDEIAEAVSNSGLEFVRPKDLFALVAQKLFDGKVFGWFQGAAEFGPRALGNRSILARPFPSKMKEHINENVKFREYFRPSAPAVLAEEAGNYFKISQESPHMLIAVDVQDDKRDVIPAVVHVDGSCRVQTVTSDLAPRFHALLSAFNKIGDIPVLLNTSFNVKGQPIVNTPQQAIESFKTINLDCLVIGDWFVEKACDR